MKGKSIFLFLIMVLGMGLVSYKFSYSFFNDSGNSTNNIFSAASVFPTPTPTAGDIVINEINWAGSNGDGNDEWVELRNTKNFSIDLSNWVVVNLGTGGGGGADITIPSGKSIPANGFFIISNKNKAASKMNIDPDLTNTSVSLSNGGEQLTLKTNTSVVIDTANGTGAWFEGNNSTPKKSMERKTPPNDGTVASNWQTATTHTNMDGSGSTDEFGSPGAANP